MESVFTAHLRNIGAYMAPDLLKVSPPDPADFACEASVIIPVRNRKGTIGDAVRSALSQETDFPFNVIAVDNHSTDGTTGVLADLTRRFTGLTHMVPQRTDLGIGGCWNEALYSEACGRYAVQLDSDDLYATAGTLQRLVDMLREGRYGMVIGAYTWSIPPSERSSRGLSTTGNGATRTATTMRSASTASGPRGRIRQPSCEG